MFRRLNLFHRIFVHGVLLIVALAVGVVLSFHAADDSPKTWFEAFSRSALLMSDVVMPRNKPQDALDKQLRSLSFVTRSSVAVYTKDGVLLSHAGEGFVPPLSADKVTSLFNEENPYQHDLGKICAAIPSKTEPSYLIVVLRGQSVMLHRFIFGLVVALIIIGAMSVPPARSIAKPIRSITDTARKLKDGDLDARVNIEAGGEIQLLASTLNDMAAALKERIRREKELLANVSHELRTPLARMRVALEIAAEPTRDTASMKRHLDEIATDVSELEQLVDDVLSAARLDLTHKDSTLVLKKEKTTMDEFTKSAAERFLRHHEHPLAVEISSSALSASMELDRTLFLRVIDNLLDNADKYSPPNAEVILAASVSDNAHIIEVKDRGEGIAESELKRIFEPFYRCDKSRSKEIRGLGLGLTFCKRIVEAHGGALAALPRDGGGTVMRVAVPLCHNVRKE